MHSYSFITYTFSIKDLTKSSFYANMYVVNICNTKKKAVKISGK